MSLSKTKPLTEGQQLKLANKGWTLAEPSSTGGPTRINYNKETDVNDVPTQFLEVSVSLSEATILRPTDPKDSAVYIAITEELNKPNATLPSIADPHGRLPELRLTDTPAKKWATNITIAAVFLGIAAIDKALDAEIEPQSAKVTTPTPAYMRKWMP